MRASPAGIAETLGDESIEGSMRNAHHPTRIRCVPRELKCGILGAPERGVYGLVAGDKTQPPEPDRDAVPDRQRQPNPNTPRHGSPHLSVERRGQYESVRRKSRGRCDGPLEVAAYETRRLSCNRGESRRWERALRDSRSIVLVDPLSEFGECDAMRRHLEGRPAVTHEKNLVMTVSTRGLGGHCHR